MTECVLCHKTMGQGTKPRTVIDWDNLKVLGQSHTGCVKKLAKYQSMRFYPEADPTVGQIAFSKKLRAFMLELEEKYMGWKWPSYEFHQHLLASEALFNVSTREQWTHLERVKTLTDWWLNGSKIITQEEYDSLFEWIASFNPNESRSADMDRGTVHDPEKSGEANPESINNGGERT